LVAEVLDLGHDVMDRGGAAVGMDDQREHVVPPAPYELGLSIRRLGKNLTEEGHGPRRGLRLEHVNPLSSRELRVPVACTTCTQTCKLCVPSACRCSSPRSEEHTSELQSRENLVCR